MKKLLVLVVAMIAIIALLNVAEALAQNLRTDGGLLVTEESLLSPGKKQAVFVVAKNIAGPARLELQMYSSEGIVNRFTNLNFPDGLKRGQIIPVWNGEFNSFHTTPWQYIWVTIFTATDTYYSSTMFPVGSRELYKEPLISSISETGGYGTPYQILAQGIFDTTIPSLILINTGLLISPKVITQTAPGKISFSVPSNSFEQFPSGKYLLTICQAGHCDTMEGRHR